MLIAFLIGLAIVIAGFIAYWIVMITLFVVVAVFLFWLGIFAKAFGDLYVGGLCSVFARGLRFDCLGCVVKKTS